MGSELFKIIIILIVQEPVDVSDPDEELLALWAQGGPPFSPKPVRKRCTGLIGVERRD